MEGEGGRERNCVILFNQYYFNRFIANLRSVYFVHFKLLIFLINYYLVFCLVFKQNVYF